MSFLPSPGHLLSTDLWTGDLQTIIQNRMPNHELQLWEHFPSSLSQMIEWATIAQHPSTPDRRHSHMLVYKTLPIPEPCNVLFPVSVRIYRFLDKFCIGDFGNWNGDCARAVYAVQSLSISSMGNMAVWRNQVEHLNLAATFASRILKIPLPSIQFQHHLHMQRKVFTKVFPSSSFAPLSFQNTEIMPKHLSDLEESQAQHVTQNATAQNVHIPSLLEPPWEWNRPLEILEMQGDGSITAIHEVLLSRSDFVEIDTEFDLIIIQTHATRTHLHVFLTCKQILCLQSASPSQACNPQSNLRRIINSVTTAYQNSNSDIHPKRDQMHANQPIY
ncbi:hypothetical protein M404DRAFT_22415 [Pisolithus tinctorius Marx 270]|uniref:Uncharacterized protein n=1 Tax=Pisolithus tinctorius Marx 270 TaxID=870435 RepID=A0A0C3KI16_PISTI|nr:hypothetical protein M404DRAFT_22415 [Pisolithus tinctorius Marx 270]